MLNLLKFIRCFVFAVFVICNAIITSAGVWNLSIVQDIAGDVVAKEISAYLIFVGVSGLVVIFTVIFFDIYGKDVFIGRVWSELLWVILFLIMELAGAVAITTQSNDLICGSLVSPCASTQVLQAFTWICATLLLGYFALLLVSATLEHKSDKTIWQCSVRKFLGRKSIPDPASLASLPTFRTQVPISIAAPRPRRIIPIPDLALSHRSGLSLEYEIEHFQPLALEATNLGSSADDRLSPLPLTISAGMSSTQTPPPPPPQKPIPSTFAFFYPSSVQAAMDPGPQRPSPAHLGQVTRLPPSPSPPPLGDWPRRNATSLPARTKRKPFTQNPPQAAVPYSFTMPSSIRQCQPRETPPSRSRPFGPRQRPISGENHGPPHSDLSYFKFPDTRGYS